MKNILLNIALLISLFFSIVSEAAEDYIVVLSSKTTSTSEIYSFESFNILPPQKLPENAELQGIEDAILKLDKNKPIDEYLVDLKYVFANKVDVNLGSEIDFNVLGKYLQNEKVFWGIKTATIVATILWNSEYGPEPKNSTSTILLLKRLPKLLLIHEQISVNGQSKDIQATREFEKLISIFPQILISSNYDNFMRFMFLLTSITSQGTTPDTAMDTGFEKYILNEFGAPDDGGFQLDKKIKILQQRLAECVMCDRILEN